MNGLVLLSGIGKGIASAIVEMLQTGHWSRLLRIRGQLDLVWLFSQVSGIGVALAERIANHLNIDSLEELGLFRFVRG